jgi:hypothetical protein
MTSRWYLAASLVALLGCPGKKATVSASADAAAPAPSLAPFVAPPEGGVVSATATLGSARVEAAATRPRTPAKSGEVIDIPAGKHAAGSTPGDEGRDHGVEPALVPVDVGAFQIDALPFPNEAGRPPQTSAGPDEADRLCKDKGKRLCTEIEWERACKGPDGDMFASGAAWDAACDKEAASCESGFHVRALGAQKEWTRSTFAGGASVVRGGPSATTRPQFAAHRCGRRGRSEGDKAIAFRCCQGKENAQELPVPALGKGFVKTRMEAPELGKILGAQPELGRIGSEIHSFEGEVAGVATRSHASSEGIVFTGSPLLWNPEAGMELLVATGRTKHLSFIVALYPLPDGKYRTASYLLLLGDVAPIALAYDPHRRKELLWTSCFGCLGEQGSITIREDHRVVIVQH